MVVLAVLIGLLITGALVAASIWPVIKDVETGMTPEYPEIQPQFYNADPGRIFDETLAAAKGLENWTVVSHDPQTRQIVAERRTRFMGFVDDILITVEPVTEFATQIRVRSTSRVGKGDFGQNARNILELFAEVDGRIGALKFDPRANTAKSEELKKVE
jgi:uncharacterized protein (DUF1499 family)